MMMHEPDEEESAAFDRFRKRDKQIDTLIDGVINHLEIMDRGLGQMEEVLLIINQANDENLRLQTGLQKGMESNIKEFETVNIKMKKMLEAYRAPHKMCMDIVLVVVLLILIGILFKVITK